MSKKEMEIVETKKEPIHFGEQGLMPTSINGLYRVAQAVFRGGFAPESLKNPEAIMIAMNLGREVGLSLMQSVQSIAVINGRPAMFGDAPLALVRNSGKLWDIKESIEGTATAGTLTAVCITWRIMPDGSKGEPKETRFSMADAELAKLWKTNVWAKYPKRMLMFRARGWNLRDNFGDILHGLSIGEEVEDFEKMKRINVKILDTPPEPDVFHPPVSEMKNPALEAPEKEAKTSTDTTLQPPPTEPQSRPAIRGIQEHLNEMNEDEKEMIRLKEEINHYIEIMDKSDFNEICFDVIGNTNYAIASVSQKETLVSRLKAWNCE